MARVAINSVAAHASLVAGQKTVTTAGTQVALASSQAVKGVTIKALHANTGMIYVGGSDVDSGDFVLDAGEQIFLEIDNLATVWIDSGVNGEGVSFIATY
jgi:hypothetical protein